ncbi:MAG: hypothetical protein V3W41_22370 [Planctomycetota bacterium]
MADVFVDTGEEFVVDQLDAFGNYFIGWGTGAGTTAKGDTTLFVEASETRVQSTDTQPSASIMQWLAQITADGTKTITNAGVFSLVTAGILIVKGDHAGVAVDAGDKIEYTIQLAVG